MCFILNWLIVHFSLHKFVGFTRPYLSVVSSNLSENGVLFRKSFSTPLSWMVPCIFFSRNFSALGFTLKSLTNLGLIFVQSDANGFDIILQHVDSLTSTICWIHTLSFSVYFWHFVKYQMVIISGTHAISSIQAIFQLFRYLLGDSIAQLICFCASTLH